MATFITIYCLYEYNSYRPWPHSGYLYTHTLWKTSINLRSYSLKGQDEQREEEMRDYLFLSPFTDRHCAAWQDGVTFPRYLRKSVAERKTEPKCRFPDDCLSCKTFLSTISQINESSNTQTATWGNTPPHELSSGFALPLPPSCHWLQEARRAVRVPVGARQGPYLLVLGHQRACFCSTDPGRWAVTWGWPQDLSWHTAGRNTTSANAQWEVNCSVVTPMLPRAPWTNWGNGRLLLLRWLMLVQEERKTWTA